MSFHKGLDIITRFWKEKKNNSDIDLRNSQHSSQSTLQKVQITKLAWTWRVLTQKTKFGKPLDQFEKYWWIDHHTWYNNKNNDQIHQFDKLIWQTPQFGSNLKP